MHDLVWMPMYAYIYRITCSAPLETDVAQDSPRLDLGDGVLLPFQLGPGNQDSSCSPQESLLSLWTECVLRYDRLTGLFGVVNVEC